MNLNPRWDGGGPVSARGRFYVQCPAGAITTLSENIGGATGDELDWVWLLPATTTPGATTIRDGGGVIWTFPGGITLTDARGIFVPLNLRSLVGAWSVNAGANMAALAAGAFS